MIESHLQKWTAETFIWDGTRPLISHSGWIARLTVSPCCSSHATTPMSCPSGIENKVGVTADRDSWGDTGLCAHNDCILGLMLCSYCSEILHHFISELMFWKWVSMGKWSMSAGKSDRECIHFDKVFSMICEHRILWPCMDNMNEMSLFGSILQYFSLGGRYCILDKYS